MTEPVDMAEPVEMDEQPGRAGPAALARAC